MSRYCVIDYETQSELDVADVGAYLYATHPSTKIMCVAWRFGSKENLLAAPIKTWSPAIDGREASTDLLSILVAPDVILKAHNALFEEMVTKYVLTRYIRIDEWKRAVGSIPIGRWRCSAAQAAAAALPRKLEHACLALKLTKQKDMEGHKLMMRMSRPRKPSKNDPRRWRAKRSQLDRLIKYCVADVEAETELFLSVPELPPQEQRLWELDQKINIRGFKADIPMVKNVVRLVAEETVNLRTETVRLTKGAVANTTQRDAVLAWIRGRGVDLPNLQAKTVQDMLDAGEITDEASRRLLEIRQATSKTSTAKYTAFITNAADDGRVRDNLRYHGASTGRWTGLRVQIHNFPQGRFIKDQWAAAEFLKDATLEEVRLLYGDPMKTFAASLRAAIVASDGHELFAGDFNAIEARVLFWLAEHSSGLKAYAQNRDLYREMATHVYGVKLHEVTDEQREVGKRIILGCGYGMGWKTFLKTCKQFAMEVEEKIGKRGVEMYRKLHEPVPKLWKAIERAAISAVRKPGRKFTTNKVTWCFEGKYLWCRLPSGRRLWYYGPQIKYKPAPWNEEDMLPVLYHWGVHPYTKQWVLDGTYGGRLVENIVQATARDFMADAMLRLEDAGYANLFTVHDEIVAEAPIGRVGGLIAFEEIMAEVPKWGSGCPLKVKGWRGPRYRKA